MAKSIFSSNVFLGTIASSFVGSSVAIGIIADKYWKKEDVPPSELIALVSLALAPWAGGAVAIKGRIDAQEQVYTPKGIYGPNKEDLKEREEGEDPNIERYESEETGEAN